MRDEIHATDGLQQWDVQTLDEFLSMLTPEKFPGFNIGLRVVIGIAVIIGFIVIFQSMYTAVMERTREIGILKSLGASKILHRGYCPARIGHAGCRRHHRGCAVHLPAARHSAREVSPARVRRNALVGGVVGGHRACRARRSGRCILR